VQWQAERHSCIFLGAAFSLRRVHYCPDSDSCVDAWGSRPGASAPGDRPHPHVAAPVEPVDNLPDEQRRALELLARSPNGCTEALMLAHGFELKMLDQLEIDGLAKADARETMAGSRAMKVVWLQITAAGRKAIAD
jgi:hypothetical protein